MALIGSLQVRLGLDTATFSQKFGSFQKDVQRRATGFQKSVRGLTNLGSLIGGAGIVSGFAAIGRETVQFDSSLRNVNTLLGYSEEKFAAFKKEASGVFAKLGEEAGLAATATYDAISAGVPEKNIFTFLADSKDAALAGISDMTTSGDALTTAVNAWQLGFENTRDAAATLFVGIKQGKTTLGDIGSSISQIAPLAAELGVSLQEVSAGTASVTTGGGKTSEAMTQMRSALVALVKPTKEMEALIAGMGYESGRAAIEALGFKGTLDGIKEAAGGNDSILGKALGSVEALGGVLRITGAGGDVYVKTMEMMKDRTDLFNDAVKTVKDGPAQKLAVFRETMTSLGRDIIGSGIITHIGSVTTALTGFAGKVATLPDWMKNLGLGIAGTAAVLPFFAFGLSSIAGIIPMVTAAAGGLAAFLLGPWGIALAAAAGLAYLFRDDLKNVFTGISAGIATFGGENKQYLDSLKATWAESSSSFRGVLTEFETAFARLSSASSSATGNSTRDSSLFANSWGQFFAGIVAGADLALQGITTFFGEIFRTAEYVGYQLAAWADDLWQNIKIAFDQLAAAWKQVTQFAKDFIAVVKTIPAAFDSILGSITYFSNQEENAFDSLQRKGTEGFSALGKSIGDTAKALTGFGDAGEKEEDRAVGNSWLTDLCEKGIANFRSLVSGGINPASDALKNFGSTGGGIKLGTFENPLKAMPVDFAPYQELSGYAAEFEGAWDIATRNTQNAMDDLVRNGKLSFKDLVGSIITDFASTQLRSAVSSLFSGIAGAASGSGGGWGSILGGVVKAFGSFDGGGYTGNGSRTGGMDGKGGRLAILHPQETVIDHTKVSASRSGSGNGGVNLSVPITLMPGVSKEELAQILPQLQKQIISVIPQLVQRGGRYANAFGQ